MDWAEKISEWLEGPCSHCGDKVSSPATMDHMAMPVARPAYVDSYLEQIAGPNEQHTLDPNAHCINPKCGYHFTPEDEQEIGQNNGEFTCPNCHFTYDYFAGSKNPTFMRDLDHEGQATWDATKARPANPGGMTRSGLTLDQMGEIGEQIIQRMHELPGIGVVTESFPHKQFPIDVVIQSQRGNFGCEIKANHSQAQERFKVGGKEERQGKIRYCLENGLKPALIGVRLNFFTDKAFVFFREGLTDTWIGNQQMVHVATVDFSDLNPFKSPDPQAQALAVENAHLPDQSSENADADLDELFRWSSPEHSDNLVTASDQPRDESGRFTFKDDVHRLKVVNGKGKHTHDITRCQNCGHSVQREAGHHGRTECPACGQDPDRSLTVAKVVLAGPSVDDIATNLGFEFAGRTGQGHRKYVYTDPFGNNHSVVVGSGAHGGRAADIDAQRGRQRMTRCLNGQCMHSQSKIVPEVDAPGSPVFRAGQTVQINDREYFIMEIDGNLALVLNTQTGAEDVVPTSELRVGA